ncbi:ATP-dependent Clp protease proteolytic subunit [Patescibacteria group bacterium]|nr:ATP-dependent Clp protease proteolytic subunit [Patescibacteria group bacterium]MBU1868587.1 ATP-dependent Clp protease proteolytic subunit [Patescibacteria group bacterium]
MTNNKQPTKQTEQKTVFIRFMAPFDPRTSDELFRIIDEKIKQKYSKINLMISSPGGSVFHGLSIYNYLKGSPIEINTYNFGSVDSIGVVVFCAGTKRYSVPHARFLIHGVKFNIRGNASFDEKEMEEKFKSLKIDQKNIAKVIADNCKKKTEDIENDMNERTTLNPSQAKDYGLVHQIESKLFPIDAEIFVIREIQNKPQQPLQFTVPNIQGYTESNDLNHGT